MEVLLVGNPNTGKTTLFNSLTSSSEHTGNWHGVTVEEKGKTYLYKGQKIHLVDLPGIYSLSPLSFEEEVACKYILNHKDNLVVNICDGANLKRNLYLTLCLIEAGLRVILVVNHLSKRMGRGVDYAKLSQVLGIEVLSVNASKKSEVQAVNEAILRGGEIGKRPSYLDKLDFSKIGNAGQDVWTKVKLLEDDPLVKEKLGITEEFGWIEQVAKARYDFIDNALESCVGQRGKAYGKSKLDKIFLNKVLALPIFLLLLAGVFYLTFFSVGKWLSEGAEFVLDRLVFSPISNWIGALFGAESWVAGLFDNALVGGVGMIVSFLPQVGLLFLFLSVLEESGYLSRIAFLFDDVLAKVGLSGKAVYTLLMGFGCSTTAVLTARNMEDKNAKIKTALLCPYMSCSAKFPIYAVLGGAFFGAGNIWVILGMYLLGVVVAVLLSLLLEKTLLKSREQSFILEFPQYKMISLKKSLVVLWQNTKNFLSRVGGVLVAMNVVVWVLSNFSFTFAYVAGGGVSMLETLGRLIAPIFTPLGFGNWALASCLIAGVVAKEVIVSSIAMFNGVEGGSLDQLQGSILSLSAVCGFAGASSLLSFLTFCLLYTPCLATISVMSKEIGAKWTVVGCLVQFGVAYFVSLIVFNVASACEIFGVARVLILLLCLLLIVLSFVFIGKKIAKKRCPYGEKCLRKCKKK